MTENERFTTFMKNGSVCLNDTLKVYKVVDVHYYEYLLDCMNELNNENEQLKEFKDGVFKRIDDRIAFRSHKPYSISIGQPMSVNFDEDMDRLARLSELLQLKEELKGGIE